MEDKLKIESKEYQLQRYPITTDHSLRAWSNAELLVLEYIKETNAENIHIYNDRFGVWNCVLNTKIITTVWTYASQQKAIRHNLTLNNQEHTVNYKTPLDDIKDIDLALIKIPKSLELFELFLQQIHAGANKDIEVVCGFMLKYFSPSFLKIANIYFDEVIQTKAWKKARLLVLKKPKVLLVDEKLITTINFKGKELKQYYGVFSSGKIDIGTRFFLENLKINSEENNVLDLASGNGVIANEVIKLNKEAKVTLLDDFNLAIESSRLNIGNEKASFICTDTLNVLPKEYFDLIVSNPPFHFEFENNIEVSLSLFKEVKNCLKKQGRFLMVANKHLNYKTHLVKLFSMVSVVNSNSKFVIYECFR